MIHCHSCGQPLPELPAYLSDPSIRFRCRFCVEATTEPPVSLEFYTEALTAGPGKKVYIGRDD